MIQSKPLDLMPMAERTVIDLTLDEDSDNSPKKSRTGSTSQAQSSNATNAITDASGTLQKKPKARRRQRKPKEGSSEPVNVVEETSKGNIPLAQRIQVNPVNGNKAANASTNNIPKRKRRESVDSTNTATLNQDEARPPPPKRLKSGGEPAPVENGDNATSKESKKKKQPKQNGKSDTEGRQAPLPSTSKQTGQVDEISNASKPVSKSGNRRNRRNSESPKPSTNGQQGHGKKSRKGTPRARSASIPASPIDNLFFVDVKPSKENKHEEEISKPAFRIVSGNLLLPEHVLLETAEEAIVTPGNESYPPPSPALSDGSIDLIDDSARNTRRYWEPEVEAEAEECRTCGQFHTSKLCIGTSVCFTCGSTEHTGRRCPFRIACFRCGVTGHVQADCPVPRHDLKSSHDCYLCGSTTHGTHNCSRNWRIYKYRDTNTRDKDIEARIALKPLILAGDKSVDEEKFVGLEPWCYNCAVVGHLGDDCLRERMEDSHREPSAFGLSNVLYGPFAPRYRRVSDDIYRQMGQDKFIVFGDQILDETTTMQNRDDIILPSGMPLRPGKSARQKEMERLGRERREDEDDWFSRNSRGDRRPPRDRDSRDHDRRRHDDDRGPRRGGDSYRDARDDRGRREPKERAHRSDRDYGRDRRPPSPRLAPPPLPASYPSSFDMAAGYQKVPVGPKSQQSGVKAPPPTPSLFPGGISILGAASRKDSSSVSDHAKSGAQMDRDHGGRGDDRRRDYRKEGKDHYNDSRNSYNSRYRDSRDRY